jgi:hypothetical protein
LCKEKCEGYLVCNISIGKCEHKGFFPIHPMELIQLVIFVVVSMIATSVGVGGILNLIVRWDYLLVFTYVH